MREARLSRREAPQAWMEMASFGLQQLWGECARADGGAPTVNGGQRMGLKMGLHGCPYDDIHTGMSHGAGGAAAISQASPPAASPRTTHTIAQTLADAHVSPERASRFVPTTTVAWPSPSIIACVPQ
ncbi:hypothetical protein Q7P37_001608 [Cladosporium fusiforme]